MNRTIRDLLNASREPMPFTPWGITIAVLFGAFAVLMNGTQPPSQSADINRDGTVAHNAVANIGISAATRACAPASRNNAMKVATLPDARKAEARWRRGLLAQLARVSHFPKRTHEGGVP